MTRLPDEAIWSAPESHVYQNTSVLDSPSEVLAQGTGLDSRGQRQSSLRHRLKERDNAFTSFNTPRGHEPPTSRRQWGSEDPSTCLYSTDFGPQ